MGVVPLAAVGFLMGAVAVLFIIACVVLVLVVLIQKGKGGGLGGAFGGAGAGGLFGTKTGDFLTWVTIAVTVLFLSLAVIMGIFYMPTISEPEQPGIRPSAPMQPAGLPQTGQAADEAVPMPASSADSASDEAGLPGEE